MTKPAAYLIFTTVSPLPFITMPTKDKDFSIQTNKVEIIHKHTTFPKLKQFTSDLIYAGT